MRGSNGAGALGDGRFERVEDLFGATRGGVDGHLFHNDGVTFGFHQPGLTIVYRVRALSTYFRSRAAEIPHVKLYTSNDPRLSGAMTSLGMDNIAPEKLREYLRQRFDIYTAERAKGIKYPADPHGGRNPCLHALLQHLRAGRASVAGIGRALKRKSINPKTDMPQPKLTSKKELRTAAAALPIGPYSQGIQVGNFVFIAGEKGIDPATGKLVPGGIAAETRQTFENIKAILAEAGATLDNAVACTVHMTDLAEFQEMNRVYAGYFQDAPPGRTTVQVVALPGGARIEITITAAV